MSAERREELVGIVRVEWRRAAAGRDVDLHDEDTAVGLPVRHVEMDQVLHDVEGVHWPIQQLRRPRFQALMAQANRRRLWAAGRRLIRISSRIPSERVSNSRV